MKPLIRPATEADAAAMLAIYGRYVRETTWSFEYEPPTEAEFRGRVRRVLTHFPWLVCEEEGRVLGYAYGDRAFERAAYGWDADLSVYLQPEARGKGLGRAFYALLEQLLARQGYQVLYALVTSENTASHRFHEALGYHLAATLPDCGFKHGRWLSIRWYEKRLSPPLPPRTAPAAASQIDWSGLDLREIREYEVRLPGSDKKIQEFIFL